MPRARGTKGKGSISLISSEDCLGGRMLGVAGVTLLGDYLSHEAVKLFCSSSFPVRGVSDVADAK